MEEHYYSTMYENEATHWWYRVRRSMVKNILSDFAKKHTKPLHILDIGCGTGLLLEELQKFGNAEGIDMSPHAIEFCKQRGLTNVQLGDAKTLPYADASLDVVVILDVIEHIEDDAAATRELARVLAPGGIVIIMVPAFMFLWGITDILSHHFRRYTKKEIANKVSGAGLKIQRATYFNTFLFPPIATVRVGRRLLGVKAESESDMGGGVGNFLFYYIFYIESLLLKIINYPFGVSILLIAKK